MRFQDIQIDPLNCSVVVRRLFVEEYQLDCLGRAGLVKVPALVGEAGVVLGAIGTVAWLAARPTGWHYGIGIVGSTGAFIQAIFDGPSVLNWGSFVVLTMPVGAFLAVWPRKQFRWKVPDLESTLRMTTAGFVMGVSATLAGGCNVGHGFTGVPTLALSSLTATVFTFLGAWLGNYLRFIRPGRSGSQVRADGEGTERRAAG